jgi:hypothetical protein
MTSHDGGGGGGSWFDRFDAWAAEMEQRFQDWLDRTFSREDPPTTGLGVGGGLPAELTEGPKEPGDR